MSTILATIGPICENISNLKKILKITSTLRINGSHNTLPWHIKISNRIKDIDPSSKILLDIPGIKPRTANKQDIPIRKNEKVIFSYSKKNLENLEKLFI